MFYMWGQLIPPHYSYDSIRGQCNKGTSTMNSFNQHIIDGEL